MGTWMWVGATLILFTFHRRDVVVDSSSRGLRGGAVRTKLFLLEKVFVEVKSRHDSSYLQLP